MALVLQEYIHYSYHFIRNGLYMPHAAQPAASHQLLSRSDSILFLLFHQVFQHCIHQKNQDYHTVQYEMENKIFLSITVAHITDVSKDFSF